MRRMGKLTRRSGKLGKHLLMLCFLFHLPRFITIESRSMLQDEYSVRSGWFSYTVVFLYIVCVLDVLLPLTRFSLDSGPATALSTCLPTPRGRLSGVRYAERKCARISMPLKPNRLLIRLLQWPQNKNTCSLTTPHPMRRCCRCCTTTRRRAALTRILDWSTLPR